MATVMTTRRTWLDDASTPGLDRLLEDVVRVLQRDAFLHDDPAAYRAGVADAVEAVRRQVAVTMTVDLREPAA